MKRICFLLLSVFVYHLSFASFKVRIEIVERPILHNDEQVFITGNFNKWNPGDSSMALEMFPDGHLGLTLYLKDIPSDRLEFKFTRGDWKTLECNSKGRLDVPRILDLNKDTVIQVSIHGWRDDFPESTASKNVHVLDSAMYIPVFKDHRTVWIYLPENYYQSDKRYPVIYMHDGQQMFDESTSTGRTGPIEWGVDEVIDEAREKCIVIAVNHNSDKTKRIEEYLVIPNAETKTANGRGYLEFIVDSLKPLVDRHYRTLPDKVNTILIGSSMGGLVSLYGGLLYPDVFGVLGILSPSIWYDEGNIEQFIRTNLDNIPSVSQQRYFFYAGSNENRKKPDGQFVQMDKDVKNVLSVFRSKADPDIKLMINPNGRHGASYWREVFPVFYQWLTINE